MASGYTIFISYLLAPTGVTTGYIYSQGIHCNYIKALQLITTTPETYEINMYISDAVNNFKFLSNNISGGTGFTAYDIYALVQMVSGTTSTVKPVAADWKLYKLTDQIQPPHTPGTPLISSELNTVFKISLDGYSGFTSYNLDYLNYPALAETDKLCFGDEVYFFGNVSTDIKADVYTTDIPVNLLLNEFNSSTNPTWDGLSSVAISEVGIYAEVEGEKFLVAIGKLNNPIIKDSTISRTIAFAIDF